MKEDETPKDHLEQIVFKAAEKEPKFELPLGFADRVVAMMEGKAVAREARRDRWWLIGGILSMVIAFAYVARVVEFSPFLSNYAGLMIFGVLFVTALHLVDKFVLKKGSQESG